MPEPSADTRELQATACLKSAETHHARLLAVARKLAGSDEGGRELFQQTVLNCHDAIQRWGYAGERYEFYLLASLKHLHYKEHKHAQRTRPFTGMELGASTADVEAEYIAELGYSMPKRSLPPALVVVHTHEANLEHLADQIQDEIRTQFTPADRVAFRLHVDGESYRDIAALVGGGDHSWISRRVAKMKTALREAFGQAWANLHAE